MNTEIIVHPRFQHFALTTADLDTMLDWYRKVLGMTINHRAEMPTGGPGGPPFSAFAFVSNDEVHHRIVFFERRGLVADPDRGSHPQMQHIAFEYTNLDDLLGSYVRLKGLGILPTWAADHGVNTSIYYRDPEQNNIELTVDNYGDAWTATEYMKTSPPTAGRAMPVDPDRIIAVRKAGATPWEIHERALAGEFAPTTPYNPRTQF